MAEPTTTQQLGPSWVCRTLAVLLGGLALGGGCKDAGPFDYVPVSGHLAYEDGTPLPAAGIRLAFEVQDKPPQGDAYQPSGDASVDAQGNFSCVTSHKYGDGLIPGKHKVTIYYATDAKGNLLVPKEYTRPTTTPLTISTDQLPLDIKVPRPGKAS
jgi:hypothetical protein